MRTAIDRRDSCESLASECETRRLSVVIADGTARYLETVHNVLEFHDIVDLVGRAANFEETIQLAIALQPDLVLMDMEMPSAMVAVAAITIAAADLNIVGMSFAGSIPLDRPGLILSVNALIDKRRLRNELLPLLRAMYRWDEALNPLGRLPRNLRLSIEAR
jgi:DNA-binding NarL/FixJ family response regulator